jgi:hypothetical protein
MKPTTYTATARRLIAAASIVLTFLMIASPFAANAADDKVGLAVSPPTFDLAANPGDTLKNNIRVDNLTDQVLDVTVSTQNFVASGEEGQAELTEDTTPYSLATWIKPAATKMEIPAKSSKVLPFSVVVPNNAEPGGHFGSLIFRSQSRPLAGTTGVSVAQQIGALLFLRVAGDLKESASIASFKSDKSFYEYPPINFDARIKNDGNVHFKPEATVTVTNMFGQKVATLPMDPKTVLPGSIRKMTLAQPWKPKFLFGNYHANLSVVYGDKKQILTATTSFTVIPYKLVGIVALVLIIVLVFIIRRRKRLAKSFKILFGKD